MPPRAAHSPARVRPLDGPEQAAANNASEAAAGSSSSQPAASDEDGDASASSSGAPSPALPPPPVPLRRSATEDGFCCPMCLDIFIDPVTLQCGHTACRGCLVRHFESLDSNQDHRQGLRESGAATCPLARCRIPFLVPEVNRTLRGAIESTHPERIAVRVSAGVPTPDSMQARINYLHARAAASGFGGLSLEDRRVVELERLRRMYAQGLRLLVARLPRMTRRWLRRETTLLATRCLRAAIAVYALALCFWFLGCPLWAEFCARRADARHVLAETTLAWLAVARLLLDWAVLGLCITVSRLLQSGFMSRTTRGWLGLKLGLSERARTLDAAIIGATFLGTALRYHVRLGVVDGDHALVWGGEPHSGRLACATALGLVLASWHGGLVTLKRLPSFVVHLALGYLGRLLIYDLGSEYAPQWWTIKLLLCPSLMVHLDLFGIAADASRAVMAYAAYALPWSSLRGLSAAARCYIERRPPSVADRTLALLSWPRALGHGPELPDASVSFVCSYWLNMTQGY